MLPDKVFFKIISLLRANGFNFFADRFAGGGKEMIGFFSRRTGIDFDQINDAFMTTLSSEMKISLQEKMADPLFKITLLMQEVFLLERKFTDRETEIYKQVREMWKNRNNKSE